MWTQTWFRFVQFPNWGYLFKEVVDPKNIIFLLVPDSCYFSASSEMCVYVCVCVNGLTQTAQHK